jgi:F-type H+-transporting ATPase subunit gamma
VPSLKAIRKRITSVQSTQKITRAMKMVAGARLNRAQQRITELRLYAVKTQEVLSAVTAEPAQDEAVADREGAIEVPAHPLLERRAEKRVLMVVLTSDRGLCGAFNANINKRAEREWKTRAADGQEVQMLIVGRKGRDYMTRRGAPILEYLPGVWDNLGLESAQRVGGAVLGPFNRKDVDAIYLVYNEFKSAMSQQVVVERLLPVAHRDDIEGEGERTKIDDFVFEPDRRALLERLVPMYVDISILRALYESQASEFGARMTAMDAATKNAKEMIGSLTLQYNKARQAAITKELMEIIGGSEALKD